MRKKLLFALNFPKSSSRMLNCLLHAVPGERIAWERTRRRRDHRPQRPPRRTTRRLRGSPPPHPTSPVFTTTPRGERAWPRCRSAFREPRSPAPVPIFRTLAQGSRENVGTPDAISLRDGVATLAAAVLAGGNHVPLRVWTTMRRCMHSGAGTDTDAAKAAMSRWHKLGPSPRARLAALTVEMKRKCNFF